MITLTKDNYTQEIEQSTLPVIIEVSATWCGPCQQMKPVVEKLAKELANKYKFAEINVDESRDLAIKFGVTSVPTFIFIKNNQIQGKERGYMPAADLKAKIEEYLG
jgi:thioredoxin 1